MFDISSYFTFQIQQDVQNDKYDTYRSSFAANLPKVYNILDSLEITNKVFDLIEIDSSDDDSDFLTRNFNPEEIEILKTIDQVGEDEIYLGYVQSMIDFDYPSQSVPLDIAMESVLSKYYSIIASAQYEESSMDALTRIIHPEEKVLNILQPFYANNTYDIDFIIYKLYKKGQKHIEVNVVERISEIDGSGTVNTTYNVVRYDLIGNMYKLDQPSYLKVIPFTDIEEDNVVDYDGYKDAYLKLKARSPY